MLRTNYSKIPSPDSSRWSARAAGAADSVVNKSSDHGRQSVLLSKLKPLMDCKQLNVTFSGDKNLYICYGCRRYPGRDHMFRISDSLLSLHAGSR